MPKKKFKDTKVGQFLSKAAPGILGTVGDVLPDQGLLGVVKNLIQKEDPVVLPPEDKEKALKLFKVKFTYIDIHTNQKVVIHNNQKVVIHTNQKVC